MQNIGILFVTICLVLNLSGMSELRLQPSCDNFGDLVGNNAELLKQLFEQGQRKYLPALSSAEATITQGLMLQESHSHLEKCDNDTITFIYNMANKERYCTILIDGIDRQIDHGEIRGFIQTNSHVINHYFSHPDFPAKITPLRYVLHKAEIDSTYTFYVNDLIRCGADLNLANVWDNPQYKNDKLKKIVEPYIQVALCKALLANDSNRIGLLLNRYSWISYVYNGVSILAWAQKHCRKDGILLKSVEHFERALIHMLCFVDLQTSKNIVAVLSSESLNTMLGYDGKTPLQWAIEYNQKEKVKLLQQAGAVVTQQM